MARKNAAPPSRRSLLRPVLVCAALALGVAIAYGGLCDRPSTFATIDDGDYVLNNPNVQAGLTPAGVYWAFTTFHATNWHPLTWLSLQLDHDLYGLEPAGFHFTNLVLHGANAALLFLLLRWATGRLWPSATVAALFAVHPLHVESVAWITERKDVLSTLFWLLTMAAYLWYARRPSAGRYLVVAAAYSLGLMAKQMLVTLPFVLLLLDCWPLRRLNLPAAGVAVRRVIAEKLPLLALAVGASVLTSVAQLGHDPLLPPTTLADRALNACLAYAGYLQKTIWPNNLAPMYTRPHGQLPLAVAVAAGIGLAVATLLALSQSKRRPYLVVGWLWYLGTLVPVIGLVSVGIQTMADRYTYVPNIGLYLAMVWGLADALADRLPRPVLAAAAGLVLAACLLLTRYHARLWTDNVALWEHAVRVTAADNFGARDNLGVALMTRGKAADGIEQFRAAIRIEPRYARAHYHLGLALEEQRRWSEAAAAFAEAIRLAPRLPEPYGHLGTCLMRAGWMADAIEPLRTAAQREPAVAATRYNLATALLYRGQTEEARREAEEALWLNPQMTEAHKLLGMACAVDGKPVDAAAHFRAALGGRPDAAVAYFIAWCLSTEGRTEAARDQYRAAAQRFPAWPAASRGEAWKLATHPDPQQRSGALALFRAQVVSQALEDRDAEALDVLAAAYAEVGRFDEALATARSALGRAADAGKKDLAAQIEKRMKLYESRQPFRDDAAVR